MGAKLGEVIGAGEALLLGAAMYITIEPASLPAISSWCRLSGEIAKWPNSRMITLRKTALGRS
jgi:hypothetical protein